MMNQQTSRPAASRPQQGGARSDKIAREARGEIAGSSARFYRPRFKVTVPEVDAGFVPGYN